MARGIIQTTDIDLSGYVQTSAVKQSTGQSTTDIMSQKAVTDELSRKQNTLTAGQNITISSNTISAGIEVIEI